MSKRQEFCLALHHLALTFFVICALPLWYLPGILSDVPPDVSAGALHAGRRQLAILFAVFTVIFLIGMIVFRLGRLPRSKFQIAALIVLLMLVSFPFLLYCSIAAELRLGKVILALYKDKGIHFLEELNGIFAFALYDEEKDAYTGWIR